MRESDIVRTVRIKHEASGTEATKAAVKSVADELKNLGNVAETTGAKQETAARRQASALASFERLERSVSPTARALADLERAQRLVGRAVEQNGTLQERGATILQAYRDRLTAAGNAHTEVGKTAGLARHELINLSRQAQDVAVSLGSGQGFGTVLLQQGSQILDVLGTSQGGIRGSLASLGASLRGLVTVGRVAFGALAAGAAGAAFATSDYLSQQKDLERSLIGAGRRSGSLADINRIGDERSSLGGLSISETREAAVEFAKTGQIHSRVIGEMIETTKNFALVTGQSSKEAAASLAGAFTNIQGIDQLNKQFNFLDAGTRGYIESLLLAGRTTEAAAVANGALAVVLKEVEGTQGGLVKGWTAIGNAVSDATTKVGEYIARSAGLQRKSKLDSAVDIANEMEGLQSRVNRGDFNNAIGDTAQLDRAMAKIEELRTKLRELNGELGSIDGSNFNALSIGAQQAIAAINPLRQKIMEVEGALQRIKALQAEGVLNPELQQAVTQYDLILQNLKNQEIALESLRSKHTGMTDQFAKQVESLEQQNRLLNARANGTEASVSAAIAYENAISAGATATEAAAIKSLTLKNNLLQAASAASDMTVQLGGSSQMEWDWDGYIAKKKAEDEAWRNGSKSIFAPDEMTQSGTFFTPSASLSDPGAMFQLFMHQASGVFAGQGGPDTKMMFENIRKQHDELLAKNTEATKENTEALNKVTLNPLYNGRDALKVGYMGAASGLDMMVQGGIPGVDSVPVHIMAQQGERVQVTPAGQVSNDNSRTSTTIVNQYFGGGSPMSRRSRRQALQGFNQSVAAAA
jgi:hypothetical protein